jgi:hypothetical protein
MLNIDFVKTKITQVPNIIILCDTIIVSIDHLFTHVIDVFERPIAIFDNVAVV